MEIKEIIAKNIADLRKQNKWTQIELAEKINYSDKAVSKWERAESTPDVDCFYKLSQIFGVTVDFFFHEDSIKTQQYKIKKPKFDVRKLLIALLLILALYIVAIVIFVGGVLKDQTAVNQIWISFIYPFPFSSIIMYLYFRIIRNKLGQTISMSCAIWSAIATLYLQLLLFGMNYWLLFLVGIPLQGAVAIIYFLKK